MALTINQKEDKKVQFNAESKSADGSIVVTLSAMISTSEYESPTINTNIVNKALFMKDTVTYQEDISSFTAQVYAKMTEILGGSE